jgi:hypothetical protein
MSPTVKHNKVKKWRDPTDQEKENIALCYQCQSVVGAYECAMCTWPAFGSIAVDRVLGM